MGLDISLVDPETNETLWEGGITHNLNTMAKKADLYDVLWTPRESAKAGDLILSLSDGVAYVSLNGHYLKSFNPVNGWGTYEEFLCFVGSYLAACRRYPEAEITVSR